MRKLTAIILALVLALSLSAALADSTISVSGTGEVLVPADVAIVSLGVNARNAEAPRAQAEANEIIARIREALTAAGFAEDDINTGYINLYGIYDYSSYGGSEKITGYNASSSLAVRVTDMSRVGEVIDLAFGAGANMLDGVSFSVQDETAARADALRMAVEDAKAKAAVLAEAAGFTNLEIENIQENGVYAYDSGANNFAVKAAGMAESAADAATIIHAAKISVNANIIITFEVK